MRQSKKEAGRLGIVAVMLALCVALPGVALAHGGEDHDAKPMEPALSAQGKRVVATLEAYAEAVQAADIDAMEKYVVANDSFTSIEGTFLDLGWASYRQHMEKEMPMFKDTEYRFSNIRPYVRGDMAYAIMDYTMNLTIESDKFEGGKHEIRTQGKTTMVLVKTRDGWKIRHMHTARAPEKKAGSGSTH
ncbi:MAG TPA: DUF4440 domain-containing protein [Chromatiales bacterium]|nr:DUF4440 domain-containing protein [Chromatiales bacterium]